MRQEPFHYATLNLWLKDGVHVAKLRWQISEHPQMFQAFTSKSSVHLREHYSEMHQMIAAKPVQHDNEKMWLEFRLTLENYFTLVDEVRGAPAERTVSTCGEPSSRNLPKSKSIGLFLFLFFSLLFHFLFLFLVLTHLSLHFVFVLFLFSSQKPKLPNPAFHFRWAPPLDPSSPSGELLSTGPPKISLFFFPPPVTIFILLSLSWGPCVELVVLKREMCTFEILSETARPSTGQFSTVQEHPQQDVDREKLETIPMDVDHEGKSQRTSNSKRARAKERARIAIKPKEKRSNDKKASCAGKMGHLARNCWSRANTTRW